MEEKNRLRKVINIYSILISIGLGAILLAVIVLTNPNSIETVQAKPIDFDKYIEKQDIETEVLGVSYPVATYNDWVPQMTEMEMTFYTDKGICKDNKTMSHEGVCAVQESMIGQTAIVYSLDDELIGIYECCDTGKGREEESGGYTIPNGHCIDIYFDKESDGWQFIKEYGNRVKVQFVYAEG